MALICSAPRVRLAGRARRLARDHRCARRRAQRARRHDRDGPACRSLDELPDGRRRPARPLPRRAADVAGSRLDAQGRPRVPALPARPGAFKVDFAVKGGVPWTAEACRTRRDRPRGRHVRRDRRGRRPRSTAGACPSGHTSWSASSTSRTRTAPPGDVHPVWAYAHVPSRWAGDETETVISQIERFAPGFRERIVAQVSKGPAEFEAYNSNFIGGDIIGGANSPMQIVSRPRARAQPVRDGHPGRLHLLGVDSAGRGRARDERLQRGAGGAPQLELASRA